MSGASTTLARNADVVPDFVARANPSNRLAVSVSRARSRSPLPFALMWCPHVATRQKANPRDPSMRSRCRPPRRFRRAVQRKSGTGVESHRRRRVSRSTRTDGRHSASWLRGSDISLPGSIRIQTERPHTNVILLTKHSDADVGSPRRRFIHEARVQVELRSGQSVHLKRVLKVDAGLSLWIRFARTST